MPAPSVNLNRTILIHVCMDRTLTYRNRRQPIFNERALPVFSVNNVVEARSLIILVSKAQYEEHPLIPGDTWYKIDMGLGTAPLLKHSDLPKVTKKLEEAYEILINNKREQSPIVG